MTATATLESAGPRTARRGCAAGQRLAVVAYDTPPHEQPRIFVVNVPSDVLLALMADAEALGPLSEPGLVERLARAVAAFQQANVPRVPVASREVMLAKAKAYIDEHLDDDQLSPVTVAEGIFVSRRYLYLLFKHEPRSVSRHIMVRRLQVAAERLVDQRSAHLSAADIAMRLGFKDPSHFARVFKAEFGITPGRFRTRHSAAVPTEPPTENGPPSGSAGCECGAPVT